MKAIQSISLILFAACFFLFSCEETPNPDGGITKQKVEEKYIFFLHNRFLEEFELTDEHPEYGRAQYKEILDRFKEKGFTVISEKRAKNTDVRLYAQKVVSQIDSLLQTGVKPNQITVIGTSKGGYIAQYVSTYLKNPEVNYVFIGCYQDSDPEEFPDIQYCGNILTIYEKTDPSGVSAIERRKTSKMEIPRFQEIELHTGLKHGFLYKPMDEWIKPSIAWANNSRKSS